MPVTDAALAWVHIRSGLERHFGGPVVAYAVTIVVVAGVYVGCYFVVAALSWIAQRAARRLRASRPVSGGSSSSTE
jgi:hypothetical protein